MSRFVIRNVRCSYPSLHKPKAGTNNGAAKYQVTLMIPKDSEEHKDIIANIRAESVRLAKERFGDKIGNKFKWPMKDGDKQDQWDTPKPEYVGHYIIGCRTDSKPGLIGPNKAPITDESVPMPGDYINCSFNLYTFDTDGNKGVTAGLGNVQFVKKGETLGNRKRAEDEFDEIESNEDSFFEGSEEADAFAETDDIPF